MKAYPSKEKYLNHMNDGGAEATLEELLLVSEAFFRGRRLLIDVLASTVVLEGGH